MTDAGPPYLTGQVLAQIAMTYATGKERRRTREMDETVKEKMEGNCEVEKKKRQRQENETSTSCVPGKKKKRDEGAVRIRRKLL